MTKNSNQGGPTIRQDPPPPGEDNLVLLGRCFLIFCLFVSKVLEYMYMKTDTTFVRMRSGDHLGDVLTLAKYHGDSPSG